MVQEDNPDEGLIHHYRAPPHFSAEFWVFWVVSSLGNGLEGAGLSVGHLVLLTSLPGT
jgi:hypothetical protein